MQTVFASGKFNTLIFCIIIYTSSMRPNYTHAHYGKITLRHEGCFESLPLKRSHGDSELGFSFSTEAILVLLFHYIQFHV